MKSSSYNTLMQSKYFSPAFNSAIFDGPIRIYFAQFHEALALKIYFMIQQKLGKELAHAKELAKASGANIFLMIYPTQDSFVLSFDVDSNHSEPLQIERWHEDVIIGLKGPAAEENMDLLMMTLQKSLQDWSPASLSPVTMSLGL